MNNYSSLQMLLHRISLSSNLIREVSHDIERTLFLSQKYDARDNHVFVMGLARSGTTILLRAIYSSNEFASLSYSDMPFILAPNLWSKLNHKNEHDEEHERAHGDGIRISNESPEAFEEVFWKTFRGEELKVKFEDYIGLILKKYQKERYLSKNNQNVRRVKKLIKLLPNSRILIPFRSPLQHSYSLLNQHQKFSKMQKADNFIRDYMDWIGHSEFGLSYKPLKTKNIAFDDPNSINHWLEQWYSVYLDLISEFDGQNNIFFICYETLCSDSSLWDKIQNAIEIENKVNFDFLESHKEISIEFDKNLFNESLNLYSDLKVHRNSL
tara:strand:- start:7306 stop:8280 length:975 start_codon:yes stop_codon:yes gene_type:complete